VASVSTSHCLAKGFDHFILQIGGVRAQLQAVSAISFKKMPFTGLRIERNQVVRIWTSVVVKLR
jgi:hypothetical protein